MSHLCRLGECVDLTLRLHLSYGFKWMESMAVVRTK